MACLLAALLLAVSGAAWYWRSHPDAFLDDGDLLGATLSARQPTLFLGVTYPDPGRGPRITIDSASLRTVENTAKATAEFYVCELDLRGRDYGALGVVDPVEFAHVCPSARPLQAGSRLDVGARRPEQLVVRVSAHQPGLLRTDGVDLTYSYGWQHGTQAIGMHLRIVSR